MGCCVSICKKDDNNSNNKPIRYSTSNNSNNVNKPSSEKLPEYSTANNSNNVNRPSSEKLPEYSINNNSNNVNKPYSEELPVYDVFLHDSYSSRTRDKSYEIVETPSSYMVSPTPISYTRNKHKEFVRDRMHDKDIRQIAGIREKYGTLLEWKGFCKAYHLLGQYLLLSRDSTVFEAEVGMSNSKWRGDCSWCLEEWCQINL